MMIVAFVLTGWCYKVSFSGMRYYVVRLVGTLVEEEPTAFVLSVCVQNMGAYLENNE